MLLLYHLSSTAQFNATYSYNSNNYYGYSMDTTLEGGYIIAGSLNNNGKDIVVIKTDNEGDTLFKYTYSTGYDEEAYCVRTCLDSGYILCGYKYNGSNNDVIVIKLDVRGVQQWSTTWNNGARETARSIVQLADSSYVLCGSAYISSYDQMLIMQVSKTGSTGWYKHYSGAQQSVATGLCKSYDGGFAMAGYGITAGNDTNAVVIRTDNGGDSLWAATEQCGGNKQANGIAAVNGNYYVIAGTVTRSSGYTDAFAWKINERGGKIFYKTYGCGYNDGAQAVRQMPDLSYILGGYKSNSTNRHGWIVKIGEWGDTVSTYTYATDYDEQFNDVTVTDSVYVAGAGTQESSPAAIKLVYVNLCKIYYPRYIWVNNLYNSAVNQFYDILGDSLKEDSLITYLDTMHYSGIVITHFEDIRIHRFDSPYVDVHHDLYTSLRNFIKKARLSGLQNIICQFRTDEHTRIPDSSYSRMIRNLDGLINYNDSSYVLDSTGITAFNGNLLDYEFWQDRYGTAHVDTIPANDSSYYYINQGFEKFKLLCDTFIDIRNNTSHHLPIAAVWIGRICDPDKYLDVNNDLVTDSNDYIYMLHTLDSFQFNRIILSFFLTDTLVSLSNYNTSKDPTAFLLRTNAKQQQWFDRLYWLGQNNLPTHVVPNFHAGYGDESDPNDMKPKLVKYLEGIGPYWTQTHVLDNAERVFYIQYYDSTTFLTHNQPFGWGSVDIWQGFEWFRYEIGPLEYASISTRLTDRVHWYHNKCAVALPYPPAARLSTTKDNNAMTVSIYPNPSSGDATLLVDNVVKDLSRLEIIFYDITGREVNVLMPESYSETSEGIAVNLKRTANYKGLLLGRITYNGNVTGQVKIVLQ